MFEQIQYKFTPPKTIAPAVTPVSSAALLAETDTRPRHQRLTEKLAVLGQTAVYLETAIKANAAATVVPVEVEKTPEIGQALKRVYGEIPSGITVEMYDNLLDTHIGITRAEMQMKSLDTGLQVNPVQKADIQTLINAYETAVVDQGDFDANTTVLLNQLKGDRLIIDNLQEGLQEYPNTQKPDEPALDISEDLADALDQRVDGWFTYYSVMNAIVTEVDSVYNDIYEITQKYFYLPIDILLKLVAAMAAVKALMHKPKLSDLRASLVWLVYPRLIAEVSKYTMLLDRLVQKAVNPVFQVLGSVDRLFAQACKISSDAAYLIGKGNFSGLRQEIGYAWNGAPKKQKKQAIAELDKLSRGFATFQGSIAKAVHETTRYREAKKRSMLKLLDRRLLGTADRLEVLETVRTVESIIQILQAMAREAVRMNPTGGLGQSLMAGLNQPLGNFSAVMGAIQGNSGSVTSIVSGIAEGANLSISLDALNNTTTAIKNISIPAPPPLVEAALHKYMPERDH